MKFENLKEKTVKWIKDPYNAIFLILLIITTFYKFRYLFQESIWVDETAYYLQSLYFLKTLNFGPFSPFTYMRLFPVSVIIFWGLFFEIFTAGRLMALSFAITGIVFTYLIGKEMKNPTAGLIAATLIAFNPYLWFHSSRTLMDAPLATMFIVCTYFFIKFEKKYSIKNLIYLIIAIILTIQTKFVGFLFVAIMATYYLIKITFITKITRKQKTGISIGVIVIASILYYLSTLDYTLYKNLLFKEIIWALGAFSYQDFYLLQMQSMLSDTVIWLGLIGLIISWIYQKKDYLIISSWAIIVYASFTFLPTGSYPRYILPALPAVILLASIGITELGLLIQRFIPKTKFKITKIQFAISIILVMLILVIPNYYETSNSMILKLSYPFSGYDEAGDWINKNVEDNSLVFVMSTSWANLFSENLYGRIIIKNSAELKAQGHLHTYIENATEPFYLIIDNWEAGAQPKWLTPTNENINNIMNMGFELVHVIQKKYPVSQQHFDEVYNKIGILTLDIDDRSLPEIPVIFIFKKIEK